MNNPASILRAAGFCFTWRRMAEGRARVSLWRVDPATRRRIWVTCAFTPDDRDAIRARALALFAWARSVPAPVGSTVEAQAVHASLTITAQRLDRRDGPMPLAAPAPVVLRVHARAA